MVRLRFWSQIFACMNLILLGIYITYHAILTSSFTGTTPFFIHFIGTSPYYLYLIPFTSLLLFLGKIAYSMIPQALGCIFQGMIMILNFGIGMAFTGADFFEYFIEYYLLRLEFWLYLGFCAVLCGIIVLYAKSLKEKQGI